MGTETERKFLVLADLWEAAFKGKSAYIRQGYLSVDSKREVRVRFIDKTKLGHGVTLSAKISVKGPPVGSTRPEFEYETPVIDAVEMFPLCVGRIIHKTRYFLTEEGEDVTNWRRLYFEVDVYHQDLAPLLVAEIELRYGSQSFEKPPWLGREVTGDFRYSNATLAVGAVPPLV